MPESPAAGEVPANSRREIRQISAAVLACFVVSGMVGLVYEVLWIRMLGLVFGHTVFAITTVLASFMGGLALGSYCFGRIADRSRRLLTLYGALEIGIGAYCFWLPALLGGVSTLYLWISRTWAPSYGVFSAIQFLLIAVLLVAPTTLMGATLPVLTRYFVREDRSLGRQVGMLYAVNTLGAVLGALLAGYWLVPTLGIQATLRMAVVANIGLGTLVIVFDRHLKQLAGPGRQETSWASPPPAALPERSPRPPSLATWAVAAGFAASGAASMIYEVTWTRALTLVIGSSTYAFTAMLVAFLAGIAAGSWIFAAVLGRRPVSPAFFAALQLAIGVSGLGLLAIFGRLPLLFLQWFQFSQSSWFLEVLQFGLSFLVMLVPTVLIGMTFPCAIRILSRGMAHVANDTGRIYAVNTAGAILGTVFAGFVGVPLWGIQWTMRIGTWINLGVAAFLALAILPGGQRRARGLLAGAAALAALAVGWLAPWDPALMSSGVAIYGYRFLPLLRAGAFERREWRPDVMYYRDGISATVSVHQEGTHVSLRVNGKTDASNTGDMHTQLFSGHIPLLLHPHPKRVLIIGLGSGVTVGAVAQYPVDRIDVIEIEPAVVEAARFFEKENRRALADPRVHLIVADGRNFLLNARTAYDVIISEPSNPWIRGLATLFSQEFYKLARNRLAPDGIMLQWVQGYGIAPEDLRMVVATFRSAFPQSTLWVTQKGDNFLVGGQTVPVIPLRQIQERFEASPALREDFNRVGLGSPVGLLADFLLGPSDLARFAGHEALNTDDTLWLEFSAPRALYEIGNADLNHRLLLSYRSADPPPIPLADADRLQVADARFRLGLAYLGKGFLVEAEAEFVSAQRLDPECMPCRLEEAGLLVQRGMALRAMEIVGAVLDKHPRSPEAYLVQGRAYLQQGLPEKATTALERAAALAPDNPDIRLRLAMAYRDRRDFDRAITAFDAARRLHGADLAVRIPAAETLLAARRAAEIPSWLQPLTGSFSRQVIGTRAKLRHLEGAAHLQLKQIDEAVSSLSEALTLNPLDVGIRLDLSRAYEAKGDLRQAASSLEQALVVQPNDAGALQRLQFLLTRMGAAS
jgi:spermidine synthase